MSKTPSEFQDYYAAFGDRGAAIGAAGAACAAIYCSSDQTERINMRREIAEATLNYFIWVLGYSPKDAIEAVERAAQMPIQFY